MQYLNVINDTLNAVKIEKDTNEVSMYIYLRNK